MMEPQYLSKITNFGSSIVRLGAHAIFHSVGGVVTACGENGPKTKLSDNLCTVQSFGGKACHYRADSGR